MTFIMDKLPDVQPSGVNSTVGMVCRSLTLFPQTCIFLSICLLDLKGGDFLSQLRLRAGASSPTGSDNSGSGGSDSSEEKAPSDAYKYQRRRSRAVLYQLSGTFDRQKSTKSKLHLNKVPVRNV